MKLRVPRRLHEQARQCADLVEDSLQDWIKNACKHYVCGRLGSVAKRQIIPDATREETAVITVPDMPLSPGEVRCAIEAAVAYCRQHTPPAFDTKTVYQGEYIIEATE
jgi:hypothetical protein